jgi:hypothetical protein
MRENPAPARLLDLARAVVRTELVHLLPEEKRYEALMAANAMAIAARALDAADGGAVDDEADLRELAHSIRAGACDDDETVYNRLMDEAEARVLISNPKYLSRP